VCGIVAAYGDIDPEKCERMLARIHHRGPDDSGRVQLGSAWLGHQRLSIMDVTGGKQPIADETDSAYVVGNGEIYNHADIRDQLSEVRFATDSDTESAFRLVLRDGSAALHDLRGMYALAMAHTDGHGVVARDPIGIKPLYWAKLPGVTLFASELRAFDEADQPMVEAFPPGYVWSPGLAESGDVAEGTMVRFADAVPVQVRPARYAPDKQWDDSVLEHIRSVLSDSVRRHMMSDVPVGVFLSGGIDSSTVAALALRHVGADRLKTFTLAFADDDFDLNRDFMGYVTDSNNPTVNYVRGRSGNNFSSYATTDPGTPVLRAYPGDDVRVHALVAPGSEQGHVFSLGGLAWPIDPNITNAQKVAAQGFGPWESISASIDSHGPKPWAATFCALVMFGSIGQARPPRLNT